MKLTFLTETDILIWYKFRLKTLLEQPQIMPGKSILVNGTYKEVITTEINKSGLSGLMAFKK